MMNIRKELFIVKSLRLLCLCFLYFT